MQADAPAEYLDDLMPWSKNLPEQCKKTKCKQMSHPGQIKIRRQAFSVRKRRKNYGIYRSDVTGYM